jgi:hypothetical protein
MNGIEYNRFRDGWWEFPAGVKSRLVTNHDYEVSTGSVSDRVSIRVTFEVASYDPVATAPGTDLVAKINALRLH